MFTVCVYRTFLFFVSLKFILRCVFEMAPFDLDVFISNPTLGQFDRCRKCDLYKLAEYYEISVSISLAKAELKTVLLDSLIGKGVISLSTSSDPEVSEGTGQPVSETPVFRPEGTTHKPFTLPQYDPLSAESSPGSKLDNRLKLRIARLHVEKDEREREFHLRSKELDLKRFGAELELKRLEAETAIKMRQLELQAGVARNVPTVGTEFTNSAVAFDVSKHISLVPVFREAEIEAYFCAFERIAAALKWPENVWAILLQCKLTGKAQEACSSLSVEDGLEYEKVKNAVLRTYELVPEAYRQRFRNLRKVGSQTYLDFAREKGILFDRWCAARKADDLSSMRELMLLEDFKSCLSERTTVYLIEQKVSTIQQAAMLADEFALIHRTVFNKRDSFNHEFPQRDETRVHNSGPSNLKTEKVCFFCRRSGHLVVDCEAWKRKQSGSAPRQP